MELNSILFPSPKLNSERLRESESDLIFIPKPNLQDQYIPCLLLMSGISNKSPKKFLIFFHGNAEDILGARDIGERLREHLNLNILIVEYPTYSIYNQETDTNKILDDCLTVFDFVEKSLQISRENIFVFGRSIGTAPAIYLASHRKPGALISVSAFTSIKAAAESLVGSVLKMLVKERFTSIENIKNVSCPVLFIHGQKDTLIPFEHSIKLCNACKCPHYLHLPLDMTHNEFDYQDLLGEVYEFLVKHTAYKQYVEDTFKPPSSLFEMPIIIRENIQKQSGKIVNPSCLGSC